MLALLLERERAEEKLFLTDALCRDEIGHDRLAVCDGAGFVEDNDLRFTGFFERNSGFEENAVFRAETVADHDRNGRGETERAGAADDKHRNAAGERIGEIFSEQQPDHEGDERHADHGRDKHARDLVGELRDRRLGRRRVAYHLDDLAERRVLTDARRLTADKAGLVDGGGADAIARGFVDGDALARECGLVYRALAVENNTVNGDALAGADEEDIALLHLVDRNNLLPAAALDAGGLRREAHQGLERVCRFAL